MTSGRVAAARTIKTRPTVERCCPLIYYHSLLCCYCTVLSQQRNQRLIKITSYFFIRTGLFFDLVALRASSQTNENRQTGGSDATKRVNFAEYPTLHCTVCPFYHLHKSYSSSDYGSFRTQSAFHGYQLRQLLASSPLQSADTPPPCQQWYTYK